jgi:hypothetical protein
MANTPKWARKAAKSYASDVRNDKPKPGPSLGPATKTQKLLASGPKFQNVKDTSYISKTGNRAKAKKAGK